MVRRRSSKLLNSRYLHWVTVHVLLTVAPNVFVASFLLMMLLNSMYGGGSNKDIGGNGENDICKYFEIIVGDISK
jgi:hypothetical protein